MPTTPGLSVVRVLKWLNDVSSFGTTDQDAPPFDTELPKAVLGEVRIQRFESRHVALEGTEPGGVVDVGREHRPLAERTVVEPEAVPELVRQDALHVDLAWQGVEGHEVPRGPLGPLLRWKAIRSALA